MVKRAAERVVVRLLIQTGRPLDRADHGRPRGTDRGVPRLRRGEGQRQQLGQRPRPGQPPRTGCCSTSASSTRPPADPRRRPGLGGHYSGVAEPLRAAAARLLRAGRRHPRPGHGQGDRQPPGRVRPVPDPPATRRSPTWPRWTGAHTSNPGWPRSPPPGIRTGGRTRSGTAAGRSSPSASSSPTSPSGAGPPPRPAPLIFPGTSPTPRTRCPATCPPTPTAGWPTRSSSCPRPGPARWPGCTPTRCCSPAPPGCASANCATSSWTACTRSTATAPG